MVGDAEDKGPATGLDHSDRRVAAEWLTRDNSDGTAGKSRATAANATREARGHQQQSDNDHNRKDQS